MKPILILVMLTAAVLTVTTLVAAAAVAFFWGGATGMAGAARASSGLMAAIYAPFALVALLLPTMAAPMARLALRYGGNRAAAAHLIQPLWLLAGLVFVAAEALIAAIRTVAGDGAYSTPLFMHLLLGGYAAAGAYLLRRGPDHVSQSTIDTL